MAERNQKQARSARLMILGSVCLSSFFVLLLTASQGGKLSNTEELSEYVWIVGYLSFILAAVAIFPLIIWWWISDYLNPIEPLLCCEECKITRPPGDFVSGYELIGTAQSTKQVTSMMPAFGTALGGGGSNIGIGAYASSSQVPIQLGRFNAIVLCPSPQCGNEVRYSFDTEVRIWNDVNGVESHEIVGSVKIPEIGLNN